MSALLEAKNLTTMLRSRQGGAKSGAGVVTAVDNVSFKVEAGRSLAIVGESGSGKSITCLSLLGLLPSSGRLVEGQVLFKGKDLARMSQSELQQVRGR
jgi:oligopeptide transport system ATP-binding protein